MSPDAIVAVVFGSIGVFGSILGWLWHRLDQARSVVSVKDQVIAAQEKTIESQKGQILVLEASAKTTLDVLSTFKVIAQSGDKT